MGKLRDLNKMRFGRLVVLDLVTDQEIKNKKKCTAKNAAWRCQCDCGEEFIAAACSLLKGNTQSCGCLAKETRSLMGKLRAGYNKKPDSALRSLYRSYKYSAEDRGYCFELEFEEFKARTEMPCSYCGSPPKTIHKIKGQSEVTFNGIDRMDNGHGYTPSNCTTCCKTCNVAKAQMGELEFAHWVCQVAENWAKAKLHENSTALGR